MRLTALHPDNFRRTPWKNGGGVSVTIAAESEPGADVRDWQSVIWQLGRTAIVTSGPFSDLTGYERLQTVVAGRGLVLATTAGDIDLRTPLSVRRYDGGLRILSRLEAGTVEVVNLIARRTMCSIDLAVLRRDEVRDLPCGAHVAYAFGAGADVKIGDTIMVLPSHHAVRIDGAARLLGVNGEAMVASIQLRGAARPSTSAG